jgi:hypothetical protein
VIYEADHPARCIVVRRLPHEILDAIFEDAPSDSADTTG